MDYSSRRRRLQEKLNEQGLDGYLVTQNVDLYYFTGSMQTGFLMIPREGEGKFYVRRSITREQEEADVPVDELGSFRKLGERLKSDFPQVFRESEDKPKLGTEFDVLPVQLFRKLEAVVHAEWADGSTMIREVRMIKSEDEVERIREAARIVDLALQLAQSAIRVGMPEVELMGSIEGILRRNGHMGIMRMWGYNQEIVTGTVGAGAAIAQPTYFDGPAGGEGLGPASPQSAGWRRLGRNEPVLVDIGCCINGYVIDQTRTMVIGKLDDDLQRAYNLSEEILRETESLLRPGTLCEELYFRSLERAEKAGLANHFMGYGVDQVKFLGHGIGLEIDELPVLARGFKYPLEAGMVIAVEPKFTFPGRGVVGIENSYVITPTGFEKLTVSQEGILVIQE